MKKLTPWFPADIKPKHNGVYPTKFIIHNDRICGYSCWENGRWSNQTERPTGVMIFTSWAGQNKQWRGLAVKP